MSFSQNPILFDHTLQLSSTQTQLLVHRCTSSLPIMIIVSGLILINCLQILLFIPQSMKIVIATSRWDS